MKYAGIVIESSYVAFSLLVSNTGYFILLDLINLITFGEKELKSSLLSNSLNSLLCNSNQKYKYCHQYESLSLSSY